MNRIYRKEFSLDEDGDTMYYLNDKLVTSNTWEVYRALFQAIQDGDELITQSKNLLTFAGTSNRGEL